MNEHTPDPWGREYPPEDYGVAWAPQALPGPVEPSPWLYAAIIVNSALYLSGVCVAGWVSGNVVAPRLALLTFGLCYIAAAVQANTDQRNRMPRALAIGLVLWSVVTGVAAGVALML